MRFVVNTCYGGFGLSKVAIDRLKELGLKPAVAKIVGETDDNHDYRAYVYPLNENRFHPLLVQVVEELGGKANTDSSELRIARVNTEYLTDHFIEEHDGNESVKWPAEIIYDDDEE